MVINCIRLSECKDKKKMEVLFTDCAANNVVRDKRLVVESDEFLEKLEHHLNLNGLGHIFQYQLVRDNYIRSYELTMLVNDL